MFIGAVVTVLVLYGIACATGSFIKKALEVISYIFKLLAGAVVTISVMMLLKFDFTNGWKTTAFIIIGTILIFSFIMFLSKRFRLVGYSISFLINSVILLTIAQLVSDNFEIPFLVYAIVLFLFPRIMWISDRFATINVYSHSEYDILTNTETDYYDTKPKDWWEDSGDSWKFLPLQVIISIPFYAAGALTIFFECQSNSSMLFLPYMLGLTALNIIFDIFVFKKLEGSK